MIGFRVCTVVAVAAVAMLIPGCSNRSTETGAPPCWASSSIERLAHPTAVDVSPDGSEIWVVDQTGLLLRRTRGRWLEPAACPGGDSWWGPEIPFGIAIRDDGLVAVSSAADGRVWIVPQQGGVVDILPLGDPNLTLEDEQPGDRVPTPHDIEWDGDSLIVADVANSTVLRMELDGSVEKIAGRRSVLDVGPLDRADSVPALEADLAFPSGLALLADGAVAVSESDAGRVSILRDGSINSLDLAAFTSSSSCLQQRIIAADWLPKPSALEWSGSGLVVSDSRVGALYVLDLQTMEATEIVGPCSGEPLFGVGDLTLDPTGNILASRNERGTVAVVSPGGETVPLS